MVRRITLLVLASLLIGCQSAQDANIAVQVDQHQEAILEPPPLAADDPPPLAPPTRPGVTVLEVAPAPHPRTREASEPSSW
ncbi:MAG: hypothetical protein RMJ56_09360 [Gemmataceae bacterium]|nr:hypothetical protein [Gemmata sp.]MDW8197796.1 hypothetical protein [Gemmataceae bacterium]